MHTSVPKSAVSLYGIEIFDTREIFFNEAYDFVLESRSERETEREREREREREIRCSQCA